MNYRKVIALLIVTSLALFGFGFFSIEPLEIPYLMKKFSNSNDSSDCGPQSLNFVLRHYGVETSLDDLIDRSGTTRKGTTLLGLRNTARGLGLTAEGWMVAADDLKNINLPVIVFIHGTHFSVLNEISDKDVLLIDPDRGALRIPLESFLEIWEGHTLLFAPPGQPLILKGTPQEESN